MGTAGWKGKRATVSSVKPSSTTSREGAPDPNGREVTRADRKTYHDMMKALTMTQPWASLVAIGENTIETRAWSTRHRGPLAIHAAKGFPADARRLCRQSPYRAALARHGYASADDLPLGSVIAVAVLADVLEFDRDSLRKVRDGARRGLLPEHEAEFGDFSPGRFGFVLHDVRRLAAPIPVRGMLGLWTLPADVEAAIVPGARPRG
jgi:hypothetical protein